MANSDQTYERWRTNAARQYRDDRFTGLWNEMVRAYRRIGESSQNRGFYQGLLVGYAVVTGDSSDAVHAQVDRAARELVA